MTELDVDREIAGRYRTVRFLGKGGMGVVYEVEHVHTGQRLAMKVLSGTHREDWVERFKREARAASRIQSDHVVRVTDADVAPELGGAPFLVMELLVGQDLERATGDRPADPGDVVEWLRQLARALAKAHEAGIVHRDLKPENLFLTRREDGTPLLKVLDFGIAKMQLDAGPLTHSGQFLGTPHYMAPEQADSSGTTISARADLFSVGLIAFRLLTGRSYWKSGSTLGQLLAQLLNEPIVPPSERGAQLGAAFDAWFLRSCDRDPERRFASAREQVEALAEALVPGETLASAPAARVVAVEIAPTLGASSRELPSRSESRPAWKRYAAFGGIGAAALVAVAVLGLGRAPANDDRHGAAQAAPAQQPSVTAAPLPVAPPAPPSATAAAPVVVEAGAPPSSSRRVLVPPPAAPRPPASARPRDPLEGQY